MLSSLTIEPCVTAAVWLERCSPCDRNSPPTHRAIIFAKRVFSFCLEQGLELDGPAGEAARRWISQPALARISSVSDPGAAAAGLPNVLLRAPSNIEQTVQGDAGKTAQHVLRGSWPCECLNFCSGPVVTQGFCMFGWERKVGNGHIMLAHDRRSLHGQLHSKHHCI